MEQMVAVSRKTNGVVGPAVYSGTLETRIEKISQYLSNASEDYWHAGIELREIYEQEIWKERGQYKNFEEFVNRVFGFSRQQAMILIDVSANYTLAETKLHGVSKLTLLSKAPPDEQSALKYMLQQKISFRDMKKVAHEIRKKREEKEAKLLAENPPPPPVKKKGKKVAAAAPAPEPTPKKRQYKSRRQKANKGELALLGKILDAMKDDQMVIEVQDIEGFPDNEIRPYTHPVKGHMFGSRNLPDGTHFGIEYEVRNNIGCFVLARVINN